MISINPRDGPFDVVIISGDAYIDHPAFGTAVIARVLEREGYTVGILAQPDWRNKDDFLKMGKPGIMYGVTSGNMDSMVANYSVFKNKREFDYYTPEGEPDRRPDRASIVYSHRAREAFKDVPIVLGGVEASLRRFAHYDYWEDKVRRSILFDAKADSLVYGMGENAIVELAKHYGKHGREEIPEGIPNTCVRLKEPPKTHESIPAFENVVSSKDAFSQAFLRVYRSEQVAQKHGDQYLVQYPMIPLTSQELDAVYDLPFTRTHPYKKRVPALDSVRFSITTHRGCFGECSFCSIYFHQGRVVVSRSEESVIREVERMVEHPGFRGTIEDLGGPSANMYGMDCLSPCSRERNCFSCKSIDKSHSRITALLERVRNIEGVKHVFVSSGIRHDLALESNDYLKQIVLHHVPGRLKVAPEHVNRKVLELMGKPPIEVYQEFLDRLKEINPKLLVLPYFIAAHPGCTMERMEEALAYSKEFGEHEQAQVFTPTPMTHSTCMYHTGKDPFTGEEVHVPTTFKEKKDQKAILTPAKTKWKKNKK